MLALDMVCIQRVLVLGVADNSKKKKREKLPFKRETFHSFFCTTEKENVNYLKEELMANI